MKKNSTNDYVFCDSLIALRNAYELGLPLNAVVLTRSPSILRASPIKAVNLDDRANVNPKKINEFFFETSSSILHLKQILDNYSHLSSFSILVSREVWNWQQHALFSIFIEENDYVDQRYFVRPDFGDHALNKRFGFDWSQFFVGAKNFQEILSPAKACDKFSYQGGTLSYADVVALSGCNHFFGRVLDGISNKLSRRIARGTVHHLRSSELVRDINIELFSKGWLPKLIVPPISQNNEKLHPITKEISSLIRGPLTERWKEISVPSTIQPILLMLEKNLNKAIIEYLSCYEWLNANSKKLFPSKNNVIVTNYPYGGSALALAKFASEQNIAFCGVQHGAARELLNQPQNQCNYENTFGNKAIVFNACARNLLEKNPFKMTKSNTRSHGLPVEYKNVGKARFQRNRRLSSIPILYVQPLNRTGNFFNGGIYKNDNKCAELEIVLIEKVFEKLRTKVCFKSYPHQSYADTDPVLERIMEANNVDLIEPNKDLRFLLDEVEIVITVGISSTLGWCLFSGKPVVYIDPVIDAYRVAEVKRTSCKEALFYFDQKSPSFEDELFEFLSQDISKISSLWATKSSKIITFKEKYFGDSTGADLKNTVKWLINQEQNNGELRKTINETTG